MVKLNTQKIEYGKNHKDKKEIPLSDTCSKSDYQEVIYGSEKFRDLVDKLDDMETLEEKEYDTLFEIECITKHSINRHGTPMLNITWASDGSSSWEKISVIKADDPVLVAEYIVSNDLIKEPKWRYKWAKRYLCKIKG